MILLHGTTRHRAEVIIKNDPDLRYNEGGLRPKSGDFSLCIEGGASAYLGEPEAYARGKARNFTAEGGPVILAVDVPEWVIELAADDGLPFEYDVIQFDASAGHKELMQVWTTLFKEIRSV